ncbi:MAG: hypothetical protein ACPLPS_08895 [bacterium]
MGLLRRYAVASLLAMTERGGISSLQLVMREIPHQAIACHPLFLFRHCEVSQRETEAI